MLVNGHTFDVTVREYEANKAKLYRSDGSQIYADQEHQERLAGLLERPKLAMSMLETEVNKTVAESERDLLTEHLDPILQLSDAEAQRAAALRGFVEDAVSEADLLTLAKTLTAILAHGGKSERALYLRAGNRRLEAFRAEHRGQPGQWTDAAGISDCTEALASLRASLADPKQGEKLSSARTRIQEAYTALQQAKTRMRELDGSSAQHRERVNSMYQSSF